MLPATSSLRVSATLRRTWAAPWWKHMVALAVLLLVLVPVIDPHVSYSADEGAAIIQARSLSQGKGWVIPHPLPEVDPTGKWFPLDKAEWGERGASAYAKHPTYPLVLAGADRLGGVVAMVLLSVLGTVLAAGAAAALSTRIEPGIETAVLWSVGLLSPLLFDSFWVIAHSLAAACAGWAVVAALTAVQRRRAVWCVGSAAGFGMAILFRTESLLLVAGVVLASSVLLLRRRGLMWAVVAASSVAAAAAARWVEAIGHHAAVGRAIVSPQISDAIRTDNKLYDVVAGFVRTWVLPVSEPSAMGSLLLMAGCAMAAVGALELGKRHPDLALIQRVSIVAAAMILLRAVALPPSAVPGLLPAFPLVWVGLIEGRTRRSWGFGAEFIAILCLVGAAGVVATQYSVGGDTEWGGRYFAVFIPLVVPYSVAGLHEAASRLAPSGRRVALAGLLVGSLGLSVLAVSELRTAHEATNTYYGQVARAARSLPSPVIVSTVGYGARLGWRTFDDQRWLQVDAERDGDVADRLAAAGIDRFVLVSRDVERDLAFLDDVRIDATTIDPTSTLAVVQYSP